MTDSIKNARLALNDCATLAEYDAWRAEHGEAATALWEALSPFVAKDFMSLIKLMEDWELDSNVPPDFVRYLHPIDSSYSIQIYTEKVINPRYKNLVVHHRIANQKLAKTIFDMNIKIEAWLPQRLQIFKLAIATLDLQMKVTPYEQVDFE